MNKAQEAQHVKEAQENIHAQDNPEIQEKPEAQENIHAQETQEEQRTPKSAGRTYKTPFRVVDIPEKPGDMTPEEFREKFDTAHPEAMPDKFRDFMEDFVYTGIVNYTEAPEMDQITAVFPDAKKWAIDSGPRGSVFVMVALTAVLTYMDSLPGYLEANGIKNSLEYFATQINPETGKTLLTDFLDYQENAAEIAAPESFIEIMAQRPKDLPAAVDKLNRKFWSIGKMPGKGMFDGTINTKPGNPKKPTVYYMFDARKALARFPDLAAEITEYDESVLSGVAAMLDIGQNYMTPDQIYYAMGYTGTPGKTDRKKIDDAFNKFTSRLVLSNKAEREAGLKYKKFEYDGDFLPFERVKGIRINGKDIDTAYHVYDYPAILRFAKDRDQLPQIPIEVKQIPINRTPFINKIEKYLINRVLNAKDGILSERILWTTLYEECGADDRMQRSRARKYAGELLDHYTAIKWIKGYKTDGDGITLNVIKRDKNSKGKGSGNSRRIKG